MSVQDKETMTVPEKTLEVVAAQMREIEALSALVAEVSKLVGLQEAALTNIRRRLEAIEAERGPTSAHAKAVKAAIDERLPAGTPDPRD